MITVAALTRTVQESPGAFSKQLQVNCKYKCRFKFNGTVVSIIIMKKAQVSPAIRRKLVWNVNIQS